MLPEKIRTLEVDIGDAPHAGHLLKASGYEFRYLAADPEQTAVALLMSPRQQLTWQDADLFAPMDQNLPEGDLFMRIRALFSTSAGCCVRWRARAWRPFCWPSPACSRGSSLPYGGRKALSEWRHGVAGRRIGQLHSLASLRQMDLAARTDFAGPTFYAGSVLADAPAARRPRDRALLPGGQEA